MIRLRGARVEDAAAIAAIYAPFVADSPFTFETEPVDADEIAARMQAGEGLYPWIVAEGEGSEILGYAYAARFRPRNAYRFAVEATVYVAVEAHRRGVGTRLYRLLLKILTEQGFTQAIAAITLPNDPSVRLHEAAGFQPAGVYRQVGYKLGAWHDVGLWQCPLGAPEPEPTEPRPFDPASLNES